MKQRLLSKMAVTALLAVMGAGLTGCYVYDRDYYHQHGYQDRDRDHHHHDYDRDREHRDRYDRW
jgi:hypothetical protein